MARWQLRQDGGGCGDGSPSLVLVLRGRLHVADIGQLRLPLRLAHDEPGVSSLVCDLERLIRPDLGTVDALARLQLIARRLDRPLTFRGASDDLIALIELVGLVEQLPCLDRPRPS